MMNELRRLGRLVVKQFGHSGVYVDGRFAGFSDEMSSLDRGLELEEGTHDVVIDSGNEPPRTLKVRILEGAAAMVLPGLIMTVRS